MTLRLQTQMSSIWRREILFLLFPLSWWKIRYELCLQCNCLIKLKHTAQYYVKWMLTTQAKFWFIGQSYRTFFFLLSASAVQEQLSVKRDVVDWQNDYAYFKYFLAVVICHKGESVTFTFFTSNVSKQLKRKIGEHNKNLNIAIETIKDKVLFPLTWSCISFIWMYYQ